MFHASHDLIACPKRMRPTNARIMAERYLPLMKLMFGDSDMDVEDIETKILGAAEDNSVSAVNQSFLTSLTLTDDWNVKMQTNATKKKGKKKKGGGSTKKKKRGGCH